MKVVKDTPFEFGYQVWQVRPPQPSLMVVVKGTFQIVHDGVCTVAEKQATTTGEVYWDDDPQNSVRYETDFAILKKRGECFLVGTCHPPGGSATTSAVAFRVGSVRKALAVIGDRSWRQGLIRGMAPPASFSSMPLRWERSFGGAGFDKNPVGRGVAPVETPEGPVHFLPNIENPHALITEKGSRPDPVGAFPIPGTWKSRARLMGTFDQRWVDTRWPWFPEDFNYDFFNAAPPDQRIDGYWRGDEEVGGQNLHPEHVVLRSRLPGLRARAFVELRSGDDVHFTEVPLQLDTITLDTDNLRVLCQWRGLIEVPSEELTEVETLFYVHEPIDQRRTLNEYYEWYQRKLHEEADEDAAFEAEEPGADEEPPEPPPAPNPMESVVKALVEQANALAKQGGAEKLTQATLLASLAGGAANADAPEPPAPPPVKPSELRAAMRADQMEVPAALENVPDPPDDDETEEPAAAPPATPEPPPALTRDEIYARYQRGEAFADLDLSGADLSGLDLARADFAKAILSGATLTNCVLDEAKFDGALLLRADLTEASLVATSFVGADLTAARGYRANADRAVFDDAIATESAWSGTRFQFASFKETDFSRGVFEDCNFQDAAAPSGDFTQATMHRSDFRRAKLVDARFEGTQAQRCQFDDADLTKLRASEGADLSESSLRAVVAKQSKWDSAVLNKSNLSLSDFTGADFAAARLVQVNFTGCTMRGARFQGASLVGVTMLKADALETNFEGADLSHADLRGSNFFGAQFWRARVEFTQLELANVGRTHLARPPRKR